MPELMEVDFTIEDFTESHYRDLLLSAKSNYLFCGYGQPEIGKQIIWRHDVDMSVQRAHRLATIENELGVQATYFFLFHSHFYNLFEDRIVGLARDIAGLGHSIGLHFDLAFYGEEIQDSESISLRAKKERDLLQDLVRKPVEAISFHNPDYGGALALEDEKIGGMWNAYSRGMKTRFRYCSDSNGYWRFDRLYDLLDSKAEDRLHILTHPEWWTPSPMRPRDRVARCIDGRANSVSQNYDQVLASFGRLNIR